MRDVRRAAATGLLELADDPAAATGRDLANADTGLDGPAGGRLSEH
ncbi:hypothetical protein ACFLIM_46145 [Nonomuraea sp. M3C6]|uniref:Uncharacterized protein n=1 Tax=Nonomuraea marmarensis TaxID=3351344 RepID=A0ABW7AWX0_9ACTN